MSLISNLINHTKKLKLSYDKKMLFDSFIQKGFPTTKDEEWKYTSLKNVVSENYVLESNFPKLKKEIFANFSLGLKNKLIFSDGVLINSPNIAGLTITDFTDFNCRENDALTELNASLAKRGFKIEIGDNAIIKDPIEVLFFNSTKNKFAQYRNQIIVGKNSEIKLVERIQDLSNTSTLTNNFTQIKCDKNSKIEYNKIQNNHLASKLIDCMNVFQKKDSVCNINTLIFGGEFVRNNLNFEQNGENCESNMSGLSLLDNDQIADNHTFVDHKTPNCKSNEMYKGIYLGRSKGVFNGKIMVRPDAQKIDAFQSNNNLLLSDYSSIDSKPQLEIYADDVKCSHGCTIGQLDEDALFYMRSRGVAKKEAKAILTYAFTSEVIDNISIPELKNLTQKLLAKKLNVNIDF